MSGQRQAPEVWLGRAGALLALACGWAAPAAAQDLVVDGRFDSVSALASWTSGGMNLVEWSVSDWQGDPHSGSARVTNVAPCASTSLHQCVSLPLPLAESYEVGGAVFLETRAPSLSGSLMVLAHAQPACAGSSVFAGATPPALLSEWTTSLTPGLTLPPSTRSVSVLLRVNKPFTPNCLPFQPPVTARFDHVRFGPTGTTPVSLQSLSIE